MNDMMKRRKYLAMASTGAVAAVAGCISSSDTPTNESSEGEEEEAAFEPTETIEVNQDSGTIQEAIDDAKEGSLIEVSGGDFEESLTIDKTISLAGTGSTTLDGAEFTHERGIIIDAPEVRLSGLEITGFSQRAIVTERQVDRIIAEDLVLREIGERHTRDYTVEIDAKEATLSDIYAQNATGDTLRIDSPRDGTVTVEDSEIRATNGVYSHTNAAVKTTGGEEITVTGLTVDDNTRGVYTERGPSQEQSVTITDSEFTNTIWPVQIKDLGDDDDVTIRNVNAYNGDNVPIEVTGEEITIEDVDINGHGPAEGGIVITSTPNGTVSVSNTRISETDRGSNFLGGIPSRRGDGIVVTDGQKISISEVDLSHNGGNGLYIENDLVRDQTVEVSDCSFNYNGRRGVQTHDESPEITINNSESIGNSRVGYELYNSTVTIKDSSATDNGHNDLRLVSIDRAEATIVNSDL